MWVKNLSVGICDGAPLTAHSGIDMLVSQTNCMKILPIRCYNDDDNDLMTTKKQRTHFFSIIKVT